MNFLEERIIKDGVVKSGNVLKVDSFLNHQMDIPLLEEIGREFKRRFGHKNVTKVITIESSGIGIAVSNACKSALEAADFVTVSNEEHAISRVIYDLDAGKYTMKDGLEK